ncbi:MAG: hypothetical protein WCR06_12445, partial [bacterium]
MKPRTTKSQSCSYHRLATVFAAATLLLSATTAHAGVTVSNRVVTTFRNVITVDDTGLPAQIEIRALTNDLPLAWRAEKERPATLIKR